MIPNRIDAVEFYVFYLPMLFKTPNNRLVFEASPELVVYTYPDQEYNGLHFQDYVREWRNNSLRCFAIFQKLAPTLQRRFGR